MKKLLLPALFAFSFLFLDCGPFISNCDARPVQDKSAEKDELEKMILKRIEERKKEMAKERAEKGLPPIDQSKSASRTTRQPSNRTKSTTPPKVNAVTADKKPSESTPVLRSKSVDPKVLEYAAPTEMTDATKPIDPDVKIQFSFAQAEWAEVIQFFADEIGYGLFLGASGPPEGTYTCEEPEMGLLEALDYLNGRLGILEPPHVLVRNGTQLVLVNESGEYPQPLIAIIRPEQLSEYGRYEVVRCVFDLENLDGNVLATQIRELVSDVHQDGFSYIQAANRMEIRERVMVLREFNGLIQNALKKEVEITTLTYEAKHIEPENLLFNLRQMMGIAENQFQTEDGSLRFSVQPLGNKIFLTGSPKKINEFERFASLIDVAFEGDDSLLEEKPYLKTHAAPGDLEVVFQVVQTLLEGEPNVKLDKDDISGNLYLWASKRVHDDITGALNEMAGGVSFSIIPVRTIRPSEAVSTVEDLLGIDSFSETPTGPKLVADSDNDRVLVHGTPQEIVLVKKMIEQIDAESTSTTGPRRSTRFIEASPRESMEIMDFLQIPGIMDTMGRSNRLRLILPQDRENYRNRNRLKRNLESTEDESENQNLESKSEIRTRLNARNLYLESTRVRPVETIYVSTPGFQDTGSEQDQDDAGQIGQTTGRTDEQYQAIDEKPTVPGAPVEVRFTEQGIVINSEDLDAADDLESRILDMLDSTSEAELPSFLQVKYRKVDEVKAILEHICGLESSGGGGGGGGGLGGLLGGAVSNAVGGAAGDALGGLLGGGGGGLGFGPDSAGSYQLEGEDVRFGTDARLNYLIVTGATTNDLDFMIDVIDIVDVDSPPVAPLDIGKTYVIPIQNRDPMVIKEKVQTMLSQRFHSAGGNAAGRPQQNAEQQIQQAVLSQLQGRNRNRRGGAAGGNADAEQPKATLGVDEDLGALLVTGPKFIYEEVAELVKQLDQKTDVVVAVEETTLDVLHIARQIKALAPDRITIVGEEDENGNVSGTGNRTSGNRNTPSTRSNRGGGTSSTSSQRAMQQSIFDAIRQRGGGRNPGGTRAPVQGR